MRKIDLKELIVKKLQSAENDLNVAERDDVKQIIRGEIMAYNDLLWEIQERDCKPKFK